jgi:Mn-dependent DtxR family transcriptional regulator
MLVVHLAHHEGTDTQALENDVGHLQTELRWSAPFATQVVERARRVGLIDMRGKQLHLTEQGRQLAQQATAR